MFMEPTSFQSDEYADRQLRELLSGLRTSSTPQHSNTASWEADVQSRNSRMDTLTSSGNHSHSQVSSPARVSSQAQSNSQRRLGVVGGEISGVDNEPNVIPTQFELPLRSLFASGQPTSSVSANTARASLSTSNGSMMSRPLASLTSPRTSRGAFARSSDFTSLAIPMNEAIPGTQKDVDDPSVSYSTNNEPSASSNSQALSALFTASDSRTPGSLSRHTTYGRSPSHTQRMVHDASNLGGHLLHIGFMEGRHSDITLHCFGRSYRLHKLLLERVPFFSSAFSGGWAESSAREITLMPEDIDSNITQTAFELAMKRIYGTVIPQEEETNAVGLFATACWLDMPELVDVCIDYLLRQMRLSELHVLIRLVTSNCYGKPGDRILSSAKAMLCRDGWEMDITQWDLVPAEVICEIVGGDPFYVPSEWERWCLALKLLNRRLRRFAIECGLVSTEGLYISKKPTYLWHAAVRPRDRVGIARMSIEDEDPWRGLYSHPDIFPLLQLLDHKIHYMHLRFEQLQHIRNQRDILGVPVLPDKVISDALWMSMELRQRVMTACENDLELGLSQPAPDAEENKQEQAFDLRSTLNKEKQQYDADLDSRTFQFDDHSGNETLGTECRKFWVPTTDVSAIIGASSEAYASGGPATVPEWKHRSQRLSATFDPADVQWPPDMALGGLGASIFDVSPSRHLNSQAKPRFTYVPPFRFCAEFPNPRSLKEKKRLYSQTVFYAGSLFNLYIQRINTSKSQQLGVYLHRAKDKELSDDPLALSGVGQLENDMPLRKSETRRRGWPSNKSDSDVEDLVAQEHDDVFDSGASKSLRANNPAKASTTSPIALSRATTISPATKFSSEERLPMSDEDIPSAANYLQLSNRSSPSALPSYVDHRSTIKTYFKIYSPSKAGRLLSVYESAPDSFTFGKSWGWKSNQMVLDDGIGDEMIGMGSKSTGAGGLAKDGKLRYMVVLGNI